MAALKARILAGSRGPRTSWKKYYASNVILYFQSVLTNEMERERERGKPNELANKIQGELLQMHARCIFIEARVVN